MAFNQGFRSFQQLVAELSLGQMVDLGKNGLPGFFDPVTASRAKYWTTDLQCSVIDRCLQLFGGYGYMREYPISRFYADSRVQRIYGGTSEIMKELISRDVLK